MFPKVVMTLFKTGEGKTNCYRAGKCETNAVHPAFVQDQAQQDAACAKMYQAWAGKPDFDCVAVYEICATVKPIPVQYEIVPVSAR